MGSITRGEEQRGRGGGEIYAGSDSHIRTKPLSYVFFLSHFSSAIGAARPIRGRGRGGRDAADARVRGGLRQGGLQGGIQSESEPGRTAASATR